MGKVIVIGCHVGGLAVIRSLGRKNQHIIALTHNNLDFAQTSRYVAERATCPDPSDETAFVDFLLDRADRWEGALIVETGDYHAVALAKHKAELSPHYRIVTPDWDTLRHFVQKEATYGLADACGVPHPRTWTPTSRDDLEPLRPRISTRVCSNRSSRTSLSAFSRPKASRFPPSARWSTGSAYARMWANV